MIPKGRLEIKNVKFKRDKSKQSENIAPQSREILHTFVCWGAEFVPLTMQTSVNFCKFAGLYPR